MLPLKMIYLHGFNSSGQATKAQLLHAAILKQESTLAYWAPTLVHRPVEAMQSLQQSLDEQAAHYRFCFVGSSLGGFYAIYLAHRYRTAQAVLINPALCPWETMHTYYGQYRNADTGEVFEVTPEFVASLELFNCSRLVDPQRFLVLLQTDDAVLDYRLAYHTFRDASRIVRTGGGHAFTDFSAVIPQILAFVS